jgi:hypothetical protein
MSRTITFTAARLPGPLRLIQFSISFNVFVNLLTGHYTRRLCIGMIERLIELIG